MAQGWFREEPQVETPEEAWLRWEGYRKESYALSDERKEILDRQSTFNRRNPEDEKIWLRLEEIRARQDVLSRKMKALQRKYDQAWFGA